MHRILFPKRTFLCVLVLQYSQTISSFIPCFLNKGNTLHAGHFSRLSRFTISLISFSFSITSPLFHSSILSFSLLKHSTAYTLHCYHILSAIDNITHGTTTRTCHCTHTKAHDHTTKTTPFLSRIFLHPPTADDNLILFNYAPNSTIATETLHTSITRPCISMATTRTFYCCPRLR